MRLFTQSPYPEFDYIVTPIPYMYCANSSLFSALRGDNYWFKYVDISPDLVLDYVWEQTAILKYNNPTEDDIEEYRKTLNKIFQWGTEDPGERVAYDTLTEIIESVLWTDDVESMIPSLRPKTLWYADHIMKPVKYQDETWQQYVTRIGKLKMEVRHNIRTKEDRALIEETSYSLQEKYSGLIPTAQTLNEATDISTRKIQRLTEQGRIWQTKTDLHKQRIKMLRGYNSRITQKQLSDVLGLSERQIRNLDSESQPDSQDTN